MANTRAKIGILTLPLWGNYGGLLQAFALYRSCERLGLNPGIAEWTTPERGGRWIRLMRTFRRKLLKALRMLTSGAGADVLFHYRLTLQSRAFVSRFIPMRYEDGSASSNPPDAYIVGSDQVWRLSYRKDHEPGFYFLSRASEAQRRSSIAYAASFGSDRWEGDETEAEECARLLRDFNAVSVREHSGVRLCRENLGCPSAVQMPDPTLLAQMSDYEDVMNSEPSPCPNKPYLASYILDHSEQVEPLIESVSQELGLGWSSLLPHRSAQDQKVEPLSVASWLSLMRGSRALITDSFHGCVFALIFHIPFVCLGNSHRGMSRFDSLLSTFGLRDRLLLEHSRDKIGQLLDKPIDWQRIDAIREGEKQRGLAFIASAFPSSSEIH